MRLLQLLLVSLAATMGAPAGSAPEAANDLLHTAKGNLRKVSLAMETVSSLAKQERVRLRTTMQELRVKYATKVKKMHKYMAADAEINHVPIATLDPTHYGIGTAPMKTAQGRVLLSRAKMCARAIKLGTSVAALMSSVDRHSASGGAAAAAAGAPAGAAAGASAGGDGAMLLDEQLPAGHIKVNTDSYGTKVKHLQRQAVTAKIQSEVDSQIIKYLKQLAQRNEEKEKHDMAAEKKARNAAWKAVTGQEGTPISAALHQLQVAEKRLHTTFHPVVVEAARAGHVASSAIQAISAAGLLDAPPSAVSTAALQRILSILRSAMAVLQTVVPVKSAFSVQFSHIGTILGREQSKLRSVMKSSMANKLSMSLSDPKFMELTKEYDEEVKMKKAVHKLCADVQKACVSPGHGRWAGPPKTAHAGAGGAHAGGRTRRLRDELAAALGAAPLDNTAAPASASVWGFATGSAVGTALFAAVARARGA